MKTLDWDIRIDKETGKKRVSYFVCCHTEEEVAECDEIIDYVILKLSQGSKSLMARDIDPKHWVDAVVVSLEHDFGANIEAIYTDQWSAVVAKKYDGTVSTYIQCDVVDHGIAATWLAFAENLEFEEH